MGGIIVEDQQLTRTSGLAVQKSQANRNVYVTEGIEDAGLAVQKSQANRNLAQLNRDVEKGLAVQKSQANRNGRIAYPGRPG